MKSFIVIGLGRFGEATARKLTELGHEVLAVDRDEHNVQNITGVVTHAIIADATEERNLKALGVKNYDCAIVAIGADFGDSILVALGLKELGVQRIICKARDKQHKKILEKIGVDRVIIPELDAGIKLAIQAADLNLIDYLELGDAYGISEMYVPNSWLEKDIQEINIRQKYGCIVVAIKKAENEVVKAPGPEYAFVEDDIVVLLGENEDLNALTRLD
ncbi:MAG: TrkA family potassium uptake protein [Oscillospiraceae bacterium]|nr:TrkA family potassium uptake protein [Oscillospiraceae bacterium]